METVFNLLLRRVTPTGWSTVPDHLACSTRVFLAHDACGHRSLESWEFHGTQDGQSPDERRWFRAERREMRRIARVYASAHRCGARDPDAGRLEIEQAAREAEPPGDHPRGCGMNHHPHRGGDRAPTGAFITEDERTRTGIEGAGR